MSRDEQKSLQGGKEKNRRDEEGRYERMMKIKGKKERIRRQACEEGKE